MKRLILLLLLAGCCHQPTVINYFKLGDKVEAPVKGIVVDVLDVKNECYPQLTYIVRFKATEFVEYCGQDLK